jgi:hypothetical protein
MLNKESQAGKAKTEEKHRRIVLVDALGERVGERFADGLYHLGLVGWSP